MKRYFLLLTLMLLCSAFGASAQPRISIVTDSFPCGNLNVHVGIDGAIYFDDISHYIRNGNMSYLQETQIPGISLFAAGKYRSILFDQAYWFGGKLDSVIAIHYNTYQPNQHFRIQTGPLALGQDLQTDSTVAKAFEGSFVCNLIQVNRFIANYHPGITAADVEPDVLHWPARGNPYLPQLIDVELAPFVDVNHDSIYNSLDGDYPALAGGIHAVSISNLLVGLKPFNYYIPYPLPVMCMTEYIGMVRSVEETSGERLIIRRTYINQGSRPITECVAGVFSDFDLGYPGDDRLGYDVMRDMVFCYNGSDLDTGYNRYEYHSPGDSIINFNHYIPAIGLITLASPIAQPSDGIDNNRNGQVDEPGEQIGTSTFMHVSNSTSGINLDPGRQSSAYYVLIGRWQNGQLRTYDTLNGTTPPGTPWPNVGTVLPCRYMFPGNTDPIGYGVGGSAAQPIALPPWSEERAHLPAGDRRSIIGTSGFDLAPHGRASFTYALLVTEPASTVAQARAALNTLADTAKATYLQRLAAGAPPTQPPLARQTRRPLFPNPADQYLSLINWRDLSGQIYQIYNLMGTQVQTGTVSDQIVITNLPPGQYRFCVGVQWGAFIKQ